MIATACVERLEYIIYMYICVLILLKYTLVIQLILGCPVVSNVQCLH